MAGQFRAPLAAALGVAITATGAMTWELAEFLSGRFLGTHAQRGVFDTLKDMAIGTLGACVYVAIALRRGSLGKVDLLG